MNRDGRKGMLSLILAAMCILVSACGGQAVSGESVNPSNPVTLTLWHYYVGENQSALEQAVAVFNQSVGMEHGIVVEALGMGSIAELEEKVEASAKGVINSDPMPDIFSSYPDVAFKIDQLGKLTDLNAYFTEEEKDRYIPGFLESGMFDEDRLLVLPVVTSTELLYVNETAWREFCTEQNLDDDVLTTWESLYETARAYYMWTDAQTPDIPWDGTALMGFDSVANYIIIGSRQLGVEVISAEDGGMAILDEAVLRPIFDVYFKGNSLGYFGSFGRFRSDDLKVGELICYVGSSSGASYFPTEVTIGNEQTPIAFLPLQYPTFDGGDSYAIQQGAGMCISSSDELHQQAAAQFLKWFTSAEQNIAFAQTTGYLPVTHEAFEDQQFLSILDKVSSEDSAERIVAGVYQVALQQILERNTYSAKPFAESYDIRTILQGALVEVTEDARLQALTLQQQGMEETEILDLLDVERAYSEWLQTVIDGLEFSNINYMLHQAK